MLRIGYCPSYLLDLHSAVHDWTSDAFWLALYQSDAALDCNVITQFPPEGGWTAVPTSNGANGVPLAVTAGFPRLSPSGAIMVQITFDDVAYLQSIPGGLVRRGLIYNATKLNRAVAVVDWGIGLDVQNSLNIYWPTADDNNCILRLGA